MESLFCRRNLYPDRFLVLLLWQERQRRLDNIKGIFSQAKVRVEVFCAHVFFVFFGLALLYGDVTQLHGYTAIGLLIFTFSGLILVAIREVRRRHNEKAGGSGLTVATGESKGQVTPSMKQVAE